MDFSIYSNEVSVALPGNDMWNRRNLIEESRRSLIDYCSLQTTAHVGYIVAIVIGGLTLISRWDIFFPKDENLLIPTIFFAILSILLGLGANIVGRTLYWSALTHSMVHKVKASCVPRREIENVLHILLDEAGKEVGAGAKKNTAWKIALRFSQTRFGIAAGVSLVGFAFMFLAFFAFMFLSFAPGFSLIIMLLFYLSVIFLISFWLMWRLLKTKEEKKSEKKESRTKRLDESPS